MSYTLYAVSFSNVFSWVSTLSRPPGCCQSEGDFGLWSSLSHIGNGARFNVYRVSE